MDSHINAVVLSGGPMVDRLALFVEMKHSKFEILVFFIDNNLSYQFLVFRQILEDAHFLFLAYDELDGLTVGHEG